MLDVAAKMLLIHATDLAGTERLAEGLAALLRKGDLVLLEGELGAGKTAFARALIRALAADPDMDVPSPTYNLVQLYEETRLPVAHVDLYRLDAPGEADELGLDEALSRGAVLVEWPERGSGGLAADPLHVSFAAASGPGARAITLHAGPSWAPRLRRLEEMRAFLGRAGWGGARRAHLEGDASTRAYERLHRDGETAILMNAPEQPDGPPVRDGLPYSRIARLAESVLPYVAVGAALRRAGLGAPEHYAVDLDAGLLLIEDLGAEKIVTSERAPITERYRAGVDLLAAMHGRDWPNPLPLPGGEVHAVPAFDEAACLIEAELVLDWYCPAILDWQPDDASRAEFTAAWRAALAGLSPTRTLALRDYHSPNMLWLPERDGIGRIGLLDFQDAVIASPAYDLVSLLQDARIDVAHALEAELLAHYLAQRLAADPAFDEAAFRRDYALLGLQRATKILGIFARLDRRDGKPSYLRHLPRIEAYVARNLAGPVPPGLREWYQANIRARAGRGRGQVRA